jgi:hypothetical protein
LNYGFISGVLASSLLLAGCSGDNEIFINPGTTTATTNPGVISQKNFSLLAEDPAPAVIDPITKDFTKTDVIMTVIIGDRNNQAVTDVHRVFFETEFGLLNPNYCDTEPDGTCSVTWSAIKPPDYLNNGPGSDFRVTITAYTIGEEAFTDSNGNGVYDNNDAGFSDIEEPYVDADRILNSDPRSFTSGDTIIDVVSTNDPTGTNGQHDLADGFFNGNGCTHTSLCAVRKTVTIWEDNILKINGP